MENHTALILTYHSISCGPPPLATPPAIFSEQMEWLAANANVVSLETLVDMLLRKQSPPPRTAVLTFDDALADFYTDAAPTLLRLKLPATVFVPTGHCGAQSNWSGAASTNSDVMSWQQLVEIARQGFTLGSHTVSHPSLTAIPLAQAEEEIRASKEELESRTAAPVEFFCYPYGKWNGKLSEAVKTHYRAACSTVLAKVGANSDVFTLPRVDAYYLRRPAMFHAAFTPQVTVYLAVRRTLRMVRGLGEAA